MMHEMDHEANKKGLKHLISQMHQMMVERGESPAEEHGESFAEKMNELKGDLNLEGHGKHPVPDEEGMKNAKVAENETEGEGPDGDEFDTERKDFMKKGSRLPVPAKGAAIMVKMSSKGKNPIGRGNPIASKSHKYG